MNTQELLTVPEEDFFAQLAAEIPEAFVDEAELAEAPELDVAVVNRRAAIIRIYGNSAEATAKQLEPDQLEVITDTLVSQYVQNSLFRDRSVRKRAEVMACANVWKQHLAGKSFEALSQETGDRLSEVRRKHTLVINGIKKNTPALRSLVEDAGGEYILGDDFNMYGGYIEYDGGHWKADAICAQTDPEAYYPSRTERQTITKFICQEVCPVREQCRQEALLNNDEWGVWGGMSFKQRQAFKAAQLVQEAAELQNVS